MACDMEEPQSMMQKPSTSEEEGPGETESSGSVSCSSGRCSDDQDACRDSPINASPNQVGSPEISYNIINCGVDETVQNLNEKLSAALLNIKAKEDLVKQHAKVAEEAVTGWEKAETEVASLKLQLEDEIRKNSTLEDKLGNLDGALKECVRQLRQSKEEQEQKVRDALINKAHDWESTKSELENQLIELQTQLEAKNGVSTVSADCGRSSELESLEKENSALKLELLFRSEDLQKLTLERELSIRAAETASKQYLESIKKVAKLEAECRRLRAATSKSSAGNDTKPLASSVCVDSLTDSQSDSGERYFGTDNEPSCSDSWASALIAELDQFKSEKVVTTNLTEIDLMDDFLEMERLAALPEADHVSFSFEVDADSGSAITRDEHTKVELEAMRQQVAEAEEKLKKMALQREGMEMELSGSQNKLNTSCYKLTAAEDKLVEVERQLNSANASRHTFERKSEAAEAKIQELESRLKLGNLEAEKLREKVVSLEATVEEHRAHCAELEAKCQSFESVEAKRRELESQFESANLEIGKLDEKINLLEKKVEEEKALSAGLASKCQNMEATEAKSNDLESQLISAQLEIEDLCMKVSLLEKKNEEDRACSAEFAAKVEAAETENIALKSQLETANVEIGKLCENIELLEKEVSDARGLNAEYVAKYRNLETAEEAMRKSLESLLNVAHTEVDDLHEKLILLEARVEEERALSAELAAYLEEAREVKNRESLESQLNSAQSEVERLRKKVDLLERKLEEEKALFVEYAVRCEAMDDELPKRKHEAELQHPATSNGDMKEKETSVSAGRLAECQKTIASLGQQLKSLATFEDFMLEAGKLELNGSVHLQGNGCRNSKS